MCVRWTGVLEGRRKIDKLRWLSPYIKRGARSECIKYRGISLLSLPVKVCAKCLEKRCREIIEPMKLDDAQRGFRPGRSTTTQISLSSEFSGNLGSMSKMSAHALSTSRMVYDRVPREKLCGLLWAYSVGGRPLLAVKSLYSYTDICVRVGEVHPQPFAVDVGTRQGCKLWSVFFIFYMNWIGSHSWVHEGVTVGNYRNYLWVFDLILLASCHHGPQYAIDRFSVACGQWYT